MSEERFEVFGNIIKDNEDIPVLLNNYQATVRLNELNDKVKELEQDLEFTTKTANELIEIKHKLEQELNSKNMLCENYNCGLNKKIKQLQQELAELKEKAIVVPVKLGDTIYVVPSRTNYQINIINNKEEKNKVSEFVVDEIRYNKYGYSVVCELDNIPFYFNYERAKRCCEHFDTEKFYGETWFTTREEAQAKLKEIQENE